MQKVYLSSHGLKYMMDEEIYNKLDLFSGYVGIDLIEQMEMHITFSELMPSFFKNISIVLSLPFLPIYSIWFLLALSVAGTITGKIVAHHSGYIFRAVTTPVFMLYNILSKWFMHVILLCIGVFVKFHDWKYVLAYLLISLILYFFSIGSYRSGVTKNNRIAEQTFSFYLNDKISRG